jgi:hypothetical protein
MGGSSEMDSEQIKYFRELKPKPWKAFLGYIQKDAQ